MEQLSKDEIEKIKSFVEKYKRIHQGSFYGLTESELILEKIPQLLEYIELLESDKTILLEGQAIQLTQLNAALLQYETEIERLKNEIGNLTLTER